MFNSQLHYTKVATDIISCHNNLMNNLNLHCLSCKSNWHKQMTIITVTMIYHSFDIYCLFYAFTQSYFCPSFHDGIFFQFIMKYLLLLALYFILLLFFTDPIRCSSSDPLTREFHIAYVTFPLVYMYAILCITLIGFRS